eukprot:GHVQ01002255.1.p1 GENE.GHVQ01002255.1~~GHVQ01002255.1.p1  ORF type:complete len:305 (+),score=54.25 GHVQ01002255.1:1131-2045(+)
MGKVQQTDSHGGEGLHLLPVKEHKYTVIWMHGLGDTATGWLDFMETLQAARGVFDHCKFIMPTANGRPITMNMGMTMPAWADVRGLDPASADDGPGWDHSIKRITRLIDLETNSPISATTNSNSTHTQHAETNTNNSSSTTSGDNNIDNTNSNNGRVATNNTNGASTLSTDSSCGSSSVRASGLFLGGFSQGAALAYCTALRYPRLLGGVVAFSGWLPMKDQYPQAVSAAVQKDAGEHMKMLHCHGEADGMVQYRWGKMSHEFMTRELKLNIKFISYPNMDHSACPKELKDAQVFLEQALQSSG